MNLIFKRFNKTKQEHGHFIVSWIQMLSNWMLFESMWKLYKDMLYSMRNSTNLTIKEGW